MRLIEGGEAYTNYTDHINKRADYEFCLSKFMISCSMSLGLVVGAYLFTGTCKKNTRRVTVICITIKKSGKDVTKKNKKKKYSPNLRFDRLETWWNSIWWNCPKCRQASTSSTWTTDVPSRRSHSPCWTCRTARCTAWQTPWSPARCSALGHQTWLIDWLISFCIILFYL